MLQPENGQRSILNSRGQRIFDNRSGQQSCLAISKSSQPNLHGRCVKSVDKPLGSSGLPAYANPYHLQTSSRRAERNTIQSRSWNQLTEPRCIPIPFPPKDPFHWPDDTIPFPPKSPQLSSDSKQPRCFAIPPWIEHLAPHPHIHFPPLNDYETA